MNIELILNNLGLSQNEAKVYLATLEMGVSSAQDIAHKAEVIRTTGYAVLDRLVDKNLVYKTKEGDKTKYVAESPRNLIKRFEGYQQQLTDSLPELQAIYNKHETKPKIIFFEGKQGIKDIYADTIKERPKEILEYNTSKMVTVFPGLPEEYLADRKKYKIKAKRIAPNDEFWSERAKKDKKEMSKTILLPEDEFTIPVEINIYNNKLAIVSYIDEMGVIIESESIANAMKKIYGLLWKRLKKE